MATQWLTPLVQGQHCKGTRQGRHRKAMQAGPPFHTHKTAWGVLQTLHHLQHVARASEPLLDRCTASSSAQGTGVWLQGTFNSRARM
jgi:hypothetical protein